MGRSGLEAYLYFVVDQEGSRGVLFLEMIFFLGGGCCFKILKGVEGEQMADILSLQRHLSLAGQFC